MYRDFHCHTNGMNSITCGELVALDYICTAFLIKIFFEFGTCRAREKYYLRSPATTGLADFPIAVLLKNLETSVQADRSSTDVSRCTSRPRYA